MVIKLRFPFLWKNQNHFSKTLYRHVKRIFESEFESKDNYGTLFHLNLRAGRITKSICGYFMYKQYWIHTIEDIGRVESLLFLVENMDIECCSVSNFIICVQQTPTKQSILKTLWNITITVQGHNQFNKLHTIFLNINFFFYEDYDW